MDKDIEYIKELISANRCEEAISHIDNLIDITENQKNKAELYFLRGKSWWHIGNRQRATADYAESTTLDPDGPALPALEMARNVDNFFNPDLLNP